MNPAVNNPLFSSELWDVALDKYAKAMHATVQLFDTESRRVLGPIHPTPVFQLFEGKGYDPGLFAECASRCVGQAENRSAVILLRVHGLAVIGASLAVGGKIVGAAVAGYVFADFAQVADIQSMARDAGISFEEVWRVAREQKPMPQARLALDAELLQVLGDAILKENFRTRRSEEIAADLERIVEHRTAALRQLSASMLRAQDDERRNIARELHDSIGQSLAYAKMSIESVARRPQKAEKRNEVLTEIAGELGRCVAEIRTVSYLLHPPLLDELGFASAAKSYAQGFSQRSGIHVNLGLPEELKRLPNGMELVLFRVLQESLTNVLRHANSESVDVDVRLGEQRIELEVRDYGKGLPPELLKRFKASGEGAGVGLSGMRERIRQLDGALEIQSSENGTSIRVTLPLASGHLEEKAKVVCGD
ncbi:MAG TPA: sensor histidine kinase [Candidatus Acidoferrales bacterium]|nr:sensor histidine kinase [Candidatus Acidoferrales bacterium]